VTITNKFKRVALSNIIVSRENRQRSELELDADGLSDSILRFGVLNPIIVSENAEGLFELIAGERRYATSIAVGLKDIPVRLVTDLDPIELQIIELDENLRRKELPWKDHVKAIGRIHQLYVELAEKEEEDWTYTKTAEQVGLKSSALTVIMRVHSDLDTPVVAKATGLREAYNMLSRRDERATSDALSDILETSKEIAAPVIHSSTGEALPPEPSALAPEESIINASFLEWAPVYTGPKFNFLHCDFPYGVNLFDGKMSGSNRHSSIYKDTPDLYWALIETLCNNLDKILTPSAHMVFWLSADAITVAKTLAVFEELAPSLEFLPMPIIWHKTDNVGILSDAQRRPRHVYEVALLASREDRKIIKAKSDVYGAPTNKEYHPSTKPEPVLRHFFEMFVDEHTRMLDPTCGGGSALRAAESLGAASVLGLEIDPEHYDNACRGLRQFRSLRKALK